MRQLNCPLCAQPAATECVPCEARIERNERGEAERATRPHPNDRRRRQTVYLRRQNAHADDSGQRQAQLHKSTAERHAPSVDDLDSWSTGDPARPFGRFTFGAAA